MQALIAAMMVVASLAGQESEAWHTVSVYDGLATMQIPAGWHEISPELLDFFAIRAAEITGGRTAETYQYGFRPDTSDVGFALPQILIQIRESGRLPYGQFLRLPSVSEVETSPIGALDEGTGPFIEEMHLDGLAFDATRKILFVESSLDLTIEGSAKVRSASFLTERGVFVVHFYDRASAATAGDATFQHVVSSVRLDDSIRYQPTWRDRWTSRYTAFVLFALAGCALSLALLFRLRGRIDVDSTRRRATGTR